MGRQHMRCCPLDADAMTRNTTKGDVSVTRNICRNHLRHGYCRTPYQPLEGGFFVFLVKEFCLLVTKQNRSDSHPKHKGLYHTN